MTIVKPNYHIQESKWRWTLIFSSTTLVALIIFCGCIYARTVEIKHDISSVKKTVASEKEENIELKNTLFKMTDPQTLETLAEEKGLIKDDNPQWVFASL